MKIVVVYQQHNERLKKQDMVGKMLKYNKITFKNHNM